MIKPYQLTGERKYLGLPFGFAFLGVSYILMGCALVFETFGFAQELSWLQILTQAYAFAFLAATYYFQKKPTKNTRLLWNITYTALFFVMVFSYLIVIVPPAFEPPSYQTTNDTLIGTNILFILYIAIHTIRNQITHPNPKKIWLPFAYMLLGFSQYSLLLWSTDASLGAYVGAYILRLISLIVFVWVTYRAFYALHKKGFLGEEAP
ncbi:MAG: hypothetical protein M1490_05885 [Candidatus Bathyarchaeota archaeon]|nr:hypothetical protein [Candidatus Bathyarchaeota archaeon]